MLATCFTKHTPSRPRTQKRRYSVFSFFEDKKPVHNGATKAGTKRYHDRMKEEVYTKATANVTAKKEWSIFPVSLGTSQMLSENEPERAM